MKYISLKIILILFVCSSFTSFSIENNNGVIITGNDNSKVIIKVFSSLTCPHCANFHNNVFKKIEKDFISNGKVRFEHHAFPLDLAALNAEKILNCENSNSEKLNFLNEIYEKQDVWASGSDINKINSNLIKIGKKHGLNDGMIKNCLLDDSLEDRILSERIMSGKKYSIKSTPTIFINEKKYEGSHNYRDFKKEIEKLLK